MPAQSRNRIKEGFHLISTAGDEKVLPREKIGGTEADRPGMHVTTPEFEEAITEMMKGDNG